MADLDVVCYFGGLSGLNVSGGQYVTGYDLHADTRSSRAVSWRKQSTDNNWVEGSFDISAVRGNITEVVAVWVYGSDANDYQRRKNLVLPYLGQTSWNITWVLDGMTEVWDCTISDYTEETQREFQYARQGVLRINVARRPRVSFTYSDGSTFSG